MFRASLTSTCLFLLLSVVFPACSSKDAAQPIIYTGPFEQAQDVEMFYTENETIKVRMTAPILNEQQNEDREFPEGIHLEFFDENGQLTSTLRANYAIYTKKDNIWKGQGKVEVKNLVDQDQLNTEELFWNPEKQKIYTDKFVTITLPTEVIYGTGLEANQDFSSYKVIKPSGEFEVDE